MRGGGGDKDIREKGKFKYGKSKKKEIVKDGLRFGTLLVRK